MNEILCLQTLGAPIADYSGVITGLSSITMFVKHDVKKQPSPHADMKMAVRALFEHATFDKSL